MTMDDNEIIHIYSKDIPSGLPPDSFYEWAMRSVTKHEGPAMVRGVQIIPSEAIPEGMIVLAKSEDNFVTVANLHTIADVAMLVPDIEMEPHVRAAISEQVKRNLENQQSEAFIGSSVGEQPTRSLTAVELMQGIYEAKNSEDWQARAEKAEKRVKELEKEVNRLKLRVMRAGRR